MAKLSIVVPCHNRPDLLRACLRSVTAFAPPATEVVVVDDGSVDGIVSAVAAEFAGVRSLRNDVARGFCAAVNAGITATTGEVVELLNDDAVVTAGWAEPALTALRNDRFGAVSPLVLLGEPTSKPVRVDSAGDDWHPAGVARKRHHGEVLSPRHLVAGTCRSASGAAAFFRRDVLDRVGLLPESFVSYFDDVDLSQRVRRAGYLIRYEPASVVYHLGGASHGPPRGELLARQSQNEERVFWRNLSPWGRAAWLVPHLAVLAGKAALRAREGNLSPWLRGRLEAWRGK